MGVFDPIAVRYEGIAWRHLVMVLYASAVHYRMVSHLGVNLFSLTIY